MRMPTELSNWDSKKVSEKKEITTFAYKWCEHGYLIKEIMAHLDILVGSKGDFLCLLNEDQVERIPSYFFVKKLVKEEFRSKYPEVQITDKVLERTLESFRILSVLCLKGEIEASQIGAVINHAGEIGTLAI
jgi:hypothetical protein